MISPSDLEERVARAIAKARFGDDGFREEDDGVQYWEMCEKEAQAALFVCQRELLRDLLRWAERVSWSDDVDAVL